MGNLQGGELLLLIVLALFILGPERLPEYAAKLARAVRGLRDLAEGAKSQLKEEMGPAFEDVNWRQLDPRQYDPRRIVREALSAPEPDKARSSPTSVARGATAGGAASRHEGDVPDDLSRSTRVPTPYAGGHNPDLPTPFDPDAT
ncbi:MAG: Sec-independent protein translocase TatB [Actinomycetota bacterium]|nr:Sec-independent protein translocase TatB [Actinomycetota bacterium]